tara:strand:- start:2122 stop:2451 length:330 start_codon:yes stop_codon:yes gene_type:complete
MNKIVSNIDGERDMTAEEQAEYDAKQTEYANDAPNRKLRMIKRLRQERLEETDFMANSDYTMPENIKTWRQQLRDLPQTYTTEAEYDELLETEGNFPNTKLKNAIWSKP